MSSIKVAQSSAYDSALSTLLFDETLPQETTAIYAGPRFSIPGFGTPDEQMMVRAMINGSPFDSTFGIDYTNDFGGYALDFSDAAAPAFLTGGLYGDVLRSGTGNDTLRGGGGSDALYGMAGNDRFVLTSTPVKVEGGSGKDILFVDVARNVELNDGNFDGIEAVQVRSGARLDMSGVSSGMKISSTSTADDGATVIGTSGADRIVAGKGGDDIHGGAGNDALFAGTGSDLFVFQPEHGRDNIYRFDILNDHIAFGGDISAFSDLKIGSANGGRDSVITIVGDTDPMNKIIVHDVVSTSLTSDLFLIGG